MTALLGIVVLVMFGKDHIPAVGLFPIAARAEAVGSIGFPTGKSNARLVAFDARDRPQPDKVSAPAQRRPEPKPINFRELNEIFNRLPVHPQAADTSVTSCRPPRRFTLQIRYGYVSRSIIFVAHHRIGHRWLLESGWCEQPDPPGEPR